MRRSWFPVRFSRGVVLAVVLCLPGASAQEAPPARKKPAAVPATTTGKSTTTGKPATPAVKPATTTTKNATQTGKPATGTKPTDPKQTTGTKPTDSAAPKPKKTTVEVLQGYLQRMNVATDKQRSNETTIFTRYPIDEPVEDGDGKARTKKTDIDLILVHVPSKKMVGFYTYAFGNVGQSADAADLYKYLLNVNDRLAVGSFFVDEEQDIGLKFALRTDGEITYDEFQSVYYALVAAVKQYRRPVMAYLTGEAKPPRNGGAAEDGDMETGPDGTRRRRVKKP